MYNRRQFLKRSAGVSASAFALPALLPQTNAGISKIGLQLWSIAKFLEADFDGSLKSVADLGYKELELYGPYPFSSEKDKSSWRSMTDMLGFSQSGYFNRPVKEFRNLLDSYGLKTPAMHVGLDTLRNNLEETAEAAHVLGQQYAGIAAIPEEERRKPDDYKRMADNFNSIGEKAKRLGIRFYYHNHGYGLKTIDGSIPFDIILERTDPSLVFFEMDIFWTTAGGADPIKYLAANAGRFKLMHVKDMTERVQFKGDGGTPQQWVELFPYITDAGSGVLDLKTILDHAKKSGVEHFIIENDAITDPQTSLKNSYQYLSSLKLTD